MINIVHRVGIKAPPHKVYEALSTIEGVSGWWTKNTSGDYQVGKIITARFFSSDENEIGKMDIEVKAMEKDKLVRWSFIDGPKEWIGTEVIFELKQDADFSIVLFTHSNWREQIEFTAHCSMKWGTFMLSLREFVETGKGKPSPYDIKIDNWN